MMKTKSVWIMLMILLVAVGSAGNTANAWDTWVSNTDPGTAEPPAAPWQAPGPITVQPGGQVWIAADNSYRATNEKVATFDMGAALAGAGATASGTHGYYNNQGGGVSESTATGPTAVPNSNGQKYTATFTPQPDWEVLVVDIPRGGRGLRTDVDAQPTVSSACSATTADATSMTIDQCVHDGPDDVMGLTEILVFPETGVLDESAEILVLTGPGSPNGRGRQIFISPAEGGEWFGEYVHADPEGEERLGIRWYTDSKGIQAEQAYSMKLSMTGAPGLWHAYWVYDATDGEWERFRWLSRRGMADVTTVPH